MKFPLICSLLLFLIPSLLCCDTPAVPETGASFSSDDLQDFLGSFMQNEMGALHVPGAVVMIVSDGEILLLKGYGFSNLETREHVHPNKALLRMGSISKLFTTTAVLQLAEQGKLNLQDDVNRYLTTFQLDDPFPAPVRVFNLLTHTSGFDERNLGSAALEESGVIPLGKYLARRMPPVVRPPGDLISYSNHGFTLAGYLVELVSGMPFAEYVHDHILKPLGMNRSGFNLPPKLRQEVITGYLFEDKQHVVAPFDFFNDGPADAFITSAPDMARFMISHLQQGRYGNAQILKPETVNEMEKLQYTHHPGMPGWCYGYWEMYRNGVRAIVHDGCVFGSTSRVLLVPEKNFGFLIVTNIDVTNHGDLTSVITARLLDHCFPAEKRFRHPEPTDDFETRAHSYEGQYRHVCYASRTLEKLGLLMGFAPEITVNASSARALTIEDREYIETEPLFFEQVTGRSFASFRKNQAGEITNLFIDTDAFERIRWYDTNRFQLALTGACLSFFAIVCIVSLIRLFRRRPEDPLKRLHAVAGTTGALYLIFIAILEVTFMHKRLFELSYGVQPALKGALMLPLATVLLTVLLWLLLFRSWSRRTGALWERLYLSSTACVAVVFLWVLHYWNLIGFHY